MQSLAPIQNIDTTMVWQRKNNKDTFDFTLHNSTLGQQSLKGRVRIDPAAQNNRKMLSINLDLKGPFSDVIGHIQGVRPFKLNIGKSTHSSSTKLYCRFPLLSAKEIQKNMDMTLESCCKKEYIFLNQKKDILVLDDLSIKASWVHNVLIVSGMNRLYASDMSWNWSNGMLSWKGMVNPDLINKMPFDCHISGPISIHGTYDGTVLQAYGNCKNIALKCPLIHWQKPAGTDFSIDLDHCIRNQKTSVKIKGFNASGSGHLHRLPSGLIDTCHMEYRLGNNLAIYRYTKKTDKDPTHHMIFGRFPSVTLSRGIFDFLKKNSPLQSDKKPCHVHMDLACDHALIGEQKIDDISIQLLGIGQNVPHTIFGFQHCVWTRGSLSAYCTNAEKKNDRGCFSFSLSPDNNIEETSKVEAHSYRFFPVWQSVGLSLLKSHSMSFLGTQKKGKGLYGKVCIGPYITKMPLLGRLLSVVSPSLFSQNFSGRGVRFSKTHIELSYADQRIQILKSLSAGYSLGILSKGYIDLKDQKMHLDGLIIPEYMVNTAFKHIPIVGWILGGSKGLLSSQFSFSGDVRQPKMKIFPLSILKLGFLKKIFS